MRPSLAFLSLSSLGALVSASSLDFRSPGHALIARETGDSKCTTYMCVKAVVNDSTVEYTLTGTGKRTPGWMAIGFGQQMAGSPMVIMWANSDGNITLSQRTAGGEVMPTVDSSPPRVATLSSALSTSSGNGAFVFTIPANSDTTQNLIFAFGTINPGSSAVDATLQQHLDEGTFTLDLTAALDSSSSSNSSTTSSDDSGGDDSMSPYQRMIIIHAILCVVGFALVLPIGALLARYLRTFSSGWYSVHWIVQFGIAGPLILAGIILGFKAAGPIGCKIMDPHKQTGIVLLALYLFQAGLGAFIHFVKIPSLNIIFGRSPQNYIHAMLGLAIIALSLYQIRLGCRDEWPVYVGLDMPNGVNILWMVWIVVLFVLYAVGLAFLPKQYRQESEWRKQHGHSREDSD